MRRMDLLMPPSAQREHDPWPQEREGYHEQPPVAYAPVRLDASVGPGATVIRRAEQIGSLVAGGGIIWTAYAVTHHLPQITRLALFPPGPLEVLGIGVLVWLIAKWCRAVASR